MHLELTIYVCYILLYCVMTVCYTCWILLDNSVGLDNRSWPQETFVTMRGSPRASCWKTRWSVRLSEKSASSQRNPKEWNDMQPMEGIKGRKGPNRTINQRICKRWTAWRNRINWANESIEVIWSYELLHVRKWHYITFAWTEMINTSELYTWNELTSIEWNKWTR